MRNGGWLGTIRPPQSSGGIITPNKLWPGTGGGTVIPATVEWWKTNEGSGTSLLTQSGSGDTLTFNGTWTTPTGFSFAVPTYNTNQSATGANITNTNFTGTTPFSVSAWIYTTESGTFEVVLGNISGGNTTGWEMGIAAGGQLNITISSNYPTSAIAVQSNSSISANAIHLIVFTYDGSQTAAGVKLYIDGTLQTNTINNNTLSTSIASGTPVVVGARGGAFFFAGSIADMRIFPSALTQAQVSLLFSGGVA